MSARSKRAPTPPRTPNLALSSPDALEKSQCVRNITLSSAHLEFGDDEEVALGVALGDEGIDSVELAWLYTAP